MYSHAIPLPRILAAVLVGLPLTALLFHIMTVLIRGEDFTLVEPPKSLPISFVRLLEDVPPPPKSTIDPPRKPEPQPRLRPAPIVEGAVTDFGGLVTDPGPIDPGPVAGGDFEGDAVPLVTSPPDYPARAAQRGIEGYVIVEFTIDALGRVHTPRVLEAQPTGIFDGAALRAISRYKYKPRVLGGEAVPVAGVRQRIVFELEG